MLLFAEMRRNLYHTTGSSSTSENFKMGELQFQNAEQVSEDEFVSIMGAALPLSMKGFDLAISELRIAAKHVAAGKESWIEKHDLAVSQCESGGVAQQGHLGESKPGGSARKRTDWEEVRCKGLERTKRATDSWCGTEEEKTAVNVMNALVTGMPYTHLTRIY